MSAPPSGLVFGPIPGASPWRSRLIPIALFLALAVPVIATWSGLREADRRAATDQTRILAEQAAARLREFTRGRVYALELLREEIAATGMDEAAFRRRAEAIQKQLGGFQAVNWVDATGRLSVVSPLESNEGALGRNVFQHSRAAPYALRARDTGLPVMTPPLDLFQGGHGFASYFPVDDPAGRRLGYVNGVFLVESLVLGSLADGVLDSYDVLITDGDQIVFGQATGFQDRAADRVSGSARAEILDRAWQLHVTPKASAWMSLRGETNFVFLIAGIALSGGLSLFLFALMENQRRNRVVAAERRILEARLQQSQKMEAIGQLAGGVAHDFNNTLTAILGNADLARSAESETQRVKFVDNIRMSCRRAAQLTSQLLTFSRKQVVKTDFLDLTQEIEAQRTFLAPLIREDIHLTMDLSPDAGVVEVAGSHVGQLLMNLLTNSVDAMPRGGTIHVTTRAESRSPYGEDGPWSVLRVQDTGTGMTDDVRRRVVEPFFTTKAPGEGTGLGLATVYGIAASAGGFLTIQSEVGKGTTVAVWMRSATAPARSERELPEAVPRNLEGTVLVVEDEEAVREATVGLLRHAGLEVVEAPDGRAALDLVYAGRRFDVVLADAVMPHLGGVAMLREMRRLDPAVGAVIFSGYADNLSQTDLEELDAVFIAKPFTERELVEAIGKRLPKPARVS